MRACGLAAGAGARWGLFKIEDKAQRASVLPFVGEPVTITGEIVGETVRVRKIRQSPAPVQH